MATPPETRPRVVFVNRFYWPDHSATAQILTDLATGLAAQGWAVTVIASRLRYDGGPRLAARELDAGVSIHRVATTRFGRNVMIGRAIDYASFYLTAMAAAARILRRGDILVAKTDPPLLQVPLAPVARLRGARQVNWMQDVYPELAVALGMRRLAGWPGRVLTALRTRSIRASAATVAIGARMRETLVTAGGQASRIAEIHNWGDDDVLAAPNHSEVEILKELKMNKLNVSFVKMNTTELSAKLKVADTDVQKSLQNPEFMKNFWALEIWSQDNVSFPGRCFVTIIEELYKKNALAKGSLKIAGEPVLLGQIKGPVLNIAAMDDHIVLFNSTLQNYHLENGVAFESISAQGGHISSLLGSRAQKTLWPQILEWFSKVETAKH